MTATKGVDFDRNVRISWLDETAMLAAEGLDHHAIRLRLMETLVEDIPSHENRRKTIMVLGRIWTRSAAEYPVQRSEALELLRTIEPQDRVWLHYGMTLLTHPFFRSALIAIGQLGRQRQTFDRETVRRRLVNEFGELGTMRDSVSRIIFSLSDWGVIMKAAGLRGGLRPLEGTFKTKSEALQTWLLTCVLEAMERKELLLPDLMRLPELFPFQLTIGRDNIRREHHFEIQRQGNGWEIVALSHRS